MNMKQRKDKDGFEVFGFTRRLIELTPTTMNFQPEVFDAVIMTFVDNFTNRIQSGINNPYKQIIEGEEYKYQDAIIIDNISENDYARTQLLIQAMSCCEQFAQNVYLDETDISESSECVLYDEDLDLNYYLDITIWKNLRNNSIKQVKLLFNAY